MTHGAIGNVCFDSKLCNLVGISIHFNFCSDKWFFLCCLAHSISTYYKKQGSHSHDFIPAFETHHGDWNGSKDENEFNDHEHFHCTENEKQPEARKQEGDADD